MKLRKYIRKTWLHIYYHWVDIRLTRFPRPTKKEVVRIPKMQGSLPGKTGAPLLVFAVADGGYFDKYGPAFIGAMLKNASGCAVHMHIYNPTDEQRTFLQQIDGKIEGIHLSFSWEKVDLSRLDQEKKGIYYYSMRFARFAEVFRQAEMNSICLDIDALLMQPIDELLARTGDAELAFYARFDKFSNSTKLLAGTLFARFTPVVENLLGDIEKHIREMISRGYLLEKLDQLVIYDRFSRRQKSTTPLLFTAYDKQTIDLDFSPGGVIWYPKGQSKKQNLYKAAQENYAAIYIEHADPVAE